MNAASLTTKNLALKSIEFYAFPYRKSVKSILEKGKKRLTV
jgi:hypothetical protein